jgi:transcriptional regulator NrdR family protein
VLEGGNGMTKIWCPYCGNEEIEVVEEHDNMEDDDHIRTVYMCPKCKKKAVRCYEYYAWENMKGDEIESKWV